MQGYWYKATVIGDQWEQVMRLRGFLEPFGSQQPPFWRNEPVLIQPISNDPDNCVVMTSEGKLYWPYPISLFAMDEK